MLTLTLIDKLQDARKYLIQRYINKKSAEIKAINGALNLLRGKRVETECALEQAIFKRAEIK